MIQQWHILAVGLTLHAAAFLFKFGTQTHSIAIAAFTALCVVGHALYTKRLELSNKAVLASVVYVLFASWQAMKPTVTFTGVALPWFGWPVIGIMAVYVLFYGAIKKGAERAIPVIVWIGFIASAYCILQAMGFDTPIVPTNRLDNGYVPASQVVAWFGHPAYAGCTLATIVPLALGIRKYWMLPFFVLAVISTKSAMAISSLVLTTIFLLWQDNKWLSGALLVICISGVCVIGVNDNGRFQMWKTAISDMHQSVRFENPDYEKKFNLFGMGLNSFQYIYHDQHPTGQDYQWLDPHNEYLKCYYELGLVGLALMLFILFSHVSQTKDVFIQASLISICLSACGMYVWSLGFTQILTVYLLGLSKE